MSDSAGVRLVDYADEPWASGQTKGLSRVFRVGWQDDETTFQGDAWPTFGKIRPDGSSVVGDYYGRQVYKVNADGRQIVRLGKEGKGPGEYEWIEAILVLGDTIVVQDDANRRLTRFTPEGVVTSRVPPLLCEGLIAPHPKGYLAAPDCRPGRVEPGWYEAPVVAWDRQGQTVDTLVRLAFYQEHVEGDNNPIHYIGVVAGLPNGGFVYARSDVPTITWYDLAGRIRQVVRWKPKGVAANRTEWEKYKKHYAGLEFREQSPAATARKLLEAEKDFRGNLPLFQWMFTAGDGSVWLTAFSWDQEPAFADIFTPLGTYAGRVWLPERFAPIDANGQYLIGWEFNRWDVAALSLYRISG